MDFLTSWGQAPRDSCSLTRALSFGLSHVLGARHLGQAVLSDIKLRGGPGGHVLTETEFLNEACIAAAQNVRVAAGNLPEQTNKSGTASSEGVHGYAAAALTFHAAARQRHETFANREAFVKKYEDKITRRPAVDTESSYKGKDGTTRTAMTPTLSRRTLCQGVPGQECIFSISLPGKPARTPLGPGFQIPIVHFQYNRNIRQLAPWANFWVSQPGVEFRGLWWLNPNRLEVGWMLASRPRVGN